MYVYHVQAWCSQRPVWEGWIPGTRVNHGFGCWELKLGPLQEQPVFLTTEQSPKPCAVLSSWWGDYNMHCYPVITTHVIVSNWINQSFSWILSVQRKKREPSDCRAWSESYFRKPMFSTLPIPFIVQTWSCCCLRLSFLYCSGFMLCPEHIA